jgi:YggT family protein
MKSLFILIDNLFQIYLWVVVINAIISWLVVFRVINTSNPFVRNLIEISYTLTEPPLRIIRKAIPLIATIDFSPVILILALLFVRNLNILHLIYFDDY